MAVNTTIGHPARGDEYFDRPQLTDRLWEKIQSGGSILFAAPRRVGKSSVLFYLMDNPEDKYRPTYIDTESVNNENEFFKRLFNLVISTLSGISRYSKLAANFSRNLAARIESIGAKGITIGDSRLNYYDEFLALVKSLDLKGECFIILVDEFAETVQNIIKDEGEREAVHFLQSNRTLRQMPEINEKIQFIFAGSIGLENIVNSLNASATINDLYSFAIPPFTKTEAKNLVLKLIEGTEYVFKEKKIQYMLNKIEWLIPFYIQLIVDEIDKLEFEKKPKRIMEKEIDEAFLQAVVHRNYFANWHTRLRRAYEGSEYNFIKDLLNYLSEHDTIPSGEILDLATAFEIETEYVNILNALKYDGYINNHDDPKIYRFNSPLLKIWWYKNVAN
ncbi:MAG: ATP-binding protein [Candidatus Aminicenantes bacterium]